VADKISKELAKAGIKSAAIHGNKSQNARQKALGDFKDNVIRALVATDIAARGIDIDDLTHVINYDLPNVPESYVHRIGRTGRAGANGIALSFCDFEEKAYLKDIQKLINISIPVIDNHDYPMEDFEIKPKEQPRGRAPRNDKPRSSSSQAKPSNGSSKRYGNR
jgi:ATP-dependent RNA helicase RhlE